MCVCVSWLSHFWLFATPWTVASQATLPLRLCRQECWSVLPFPSPRDLTDTEIKLASSAAPALQMDSLPLNHLKWSEMKVTQQCPSLCNPMDYTVHGILQARILDWVAFPFSSGSSQARDQTQVPRFADRFLTSWATSHLGGQLMIWEIHSSVQFSHSVMSDSLWPRESQHTRPHCPSPTTRVH